MTTQDFKLTELQFEEISILSMQKKSQEIKDYVKDNYGVIGLKVLNSMYKQDDLEEEAEFLKSLEGKDKFEKHYLIRQRNKQKLKELKEVLNEYSL